MSESAFRGTLWITGDPDVDDIVNRNPLALMIGMLLDQQISIELAFRGPSRLRDRINGPFAAQTIADYPPDEFVELCRAKPAVHRFPRSMGERIQELARHLAETYGGDPCGIWTRPDGSLRDADEVRSRLEAVPGFGSEKSRILLAVLGKRFGLLMSGWEAAAAPFSDDQPRSVADMGSPEEHQAVREWKKAQKAAGRAKHD